MSKNGFSIDNATFQLLCSRLSNDRKISANELDKLITYMGNKKNIDISDIQTVISDTSASSQEDLCYFVAQGFTEKAVASYNRLVFEGEQPVSLIRTLSYHFMKLLDCAVKMEKGETADKVVFGMQTASDVFPQKCLFEPAPDMEPDADNECAGAIVPNGKRMQNNGFSG